MASITALGRFLLCDRDANEGSSGECKQWHRHHKKKDLEKYFLLVFLFLPVTLTLLHFHLLTYSSPTSPSLTYFSWPVLPESVSVVSCVKPSSFLFLVTPHSNTPLTHACTHAHVRVHVCFFASVYSLQCREVP